MHLRGINNTKLSSLTSKGLFPLSLALYCLLYPLEYLSIGGFLSVTRLLYLVVVAAFFINIKSVRVPRDGLFGICVLYALFVLIAVGHSPSATAIDSFMKYFMNISLVILAPCMPFKKEDFEFVVKALLVSSWLMFVAYLINSGGYSRVATSDRAVAVIGGSTTDPNTFCTYFLPAAGFHLFRFFERRKIIDMVAGFAFVIIPLNAGSRGGLLGYFALLLAVFIVYSIKEKNSLKSITIGFVVIVAAYTAFSFAMSTLSSGLAERFSLEYILANGDTGRSQIRDYLIQSFLGFDIVNQMIGQGLGSTPYFNPGGFVAHNTLLEALIELGVFGLLTLLFLYVSSIAKLFRADAPYLSAVLFALFVMGLTLSLNTWKTVWILFMFAVIYSSNSSRWKRSDGK